MITETDHLLVCLAEECSEIQKRACKALRFGLDERDPTIPDAPTERERLIQEIVDLLAIVEMLEDRNVIRIGDTRSALRRSEIREKKNKVLRFFNYAREAGVLLPKEFPAVAHQVKQSAIGNRQSAIS